LLRAARAAGRTDSWLVESFIALGGLFFCPGGEAWAYSVAVDASVIGQAYSLPTADPGGAVRVDRRRLSAYLGLSVDGIGRKDADGLPSVRDQFGVMLEMRVESDLGDYLCNIGRVATGSPLGCLEPQRRGVRTDPELSNYRPELLLAYAEGRNLGGFLDVRLGRQVLWDLLDLRGLDGGWLSVRMPIHVALEGFGGLSQNGSLPIDPPMYVLDGTSRDSRLLPTDPEQQYAALQPTVGASLRTSGLRDVQARLSYRRTFSATQNPVPPGCIEAGTGACAPPLGTIEERLAYTVHGRFLGGRLQGFSALRYDFASGRIDDGEAGVRGVLRPGHFLSADYRYSAPTFDGDSIWNVFATEPYHSVQASYDGRSTALSRVSGGELGLHARAFARLYGTPAGAGAGRDGPLASTAVGGDVGVRYRRSGGFVRIDGYCDGGYGGLRAGADLSGRLLLWRDTIGLEGRVYYFYWADELREASRSHGVSLQGGVRWAVFRGALLHVLVEDNVDRFYNSQLRLLATLDLSLLLGPGEKGRAPTGLLAAGFGQFPPRGLMPGVLPWQ
jgi:hypothetical protein